MHDKMRFNNRNVDARAYLLEDSPKCLSWYKATGTGYSPHCE